MSVKTMNSIREKFHNFFISHDKIKYFVQIYIIMALIAAVLLNLFAFLVLILVHYFMNILHIHNGYSKKFSLIKSLQECNVDFMFFFVGLGIDMILHFAMAAAVARGKGMFRNLIRAVPRAAGIIKAAKGTSHLLIDLLRHGKHKAHNNKENKERLEIREKIIFEQWDYVAVIISFLFVAVGIFVLASNGYNLQRIC